VPPPAESLRRSRHSSADSGHRTEL
jgi:hypothetical protein